MLDALRSFLAGLRDDATASAADDPALAVTALLVHVVGIDGVVEGAERTALERIVAARWGLDAAGARRLVTEAAAAEREAVDLYRFTSLLKRRLDEAGRLAVVEMLWEVVLADGDLHEFEDNVVWRVAELLGVGTRDRVLLRKKVEGRAGGVESD